ncbi:MAG: hypothetical protein ACOYOO_05665 [Saprospiraceae bacterium]
MAKPLGSVIVIKQTTHTVFRDIRFWLLLCSLILLIWGSLKGYPV